MRGAALPLLAAAGLLAGGCTAAPGPLGSPRDPTPLRILTERELGPSRGDLAPWSPWQVVAHGAPEADPAPADPAVADPAPAGPDSGDPRGLLAPDPAPAGPGGSGRASAAPASSALRPSGPTLAVPARRGPPLPAPGPRTPEQVAEETRRHFLRHPTLVVAERVTLHCPPGLFGTAALTGVQVRDLAPGRREARGRARLVLGELTIEADRISLRRHEDGQADVQVLARGGAAIVSAVGDHVLRHEGLKSLLVTNDRVVPIP